MPWKWYESQVVDIVEHTANTKSFWLKIDDMAGFDFTPGQFITLDLPTGEKRINRWRSYSVANLPSHDGLIELCIVRLDGGLASEFLFSKLKIGDTLKFKGPDGSFILPEGDDKEIVMICTGTGIAPFRSMILDLQQRGRFNYPVHLIFGTRFQSDILYRQEMETLAEAEPNFTYTCVLSRDVNWEGPRGYVHQVYLENHGIPNPKKLFLLCGWTMMVDEAVANLIMKLGYDKSQVKFELYG